MEEEVNDDKMSKNQLCRILYLKQARSLIHFQITSFPGFPTTSQHAFRTHCEVTLSI